LEIMEREPVSRPAYRPRSLEDRRPTSPDLRAFALGLLNRCAQPWILGVFALAFFVRVFFLLRVDQPLLFVHQLHYFTNGLSIAQHPRPLFFVLGSDRWRTWAEHWTIAPLYYVFEGIVFKIFGPHLRPLQYIQCLLGAGSAVAVAALGRELVGKGGVWAGVLYSFYAQAVELPSWTLTENLHNAVFLVAMVFVLKALRYDKGYEWPVTAGVLLGISALARSVSSAFIPLSALWLFWYATTDRFRRAGILFGCGILAILPWSLRNVALGEWVPIETAAYENIWTANNFATPERLQLQSDFIRSRKTAAEKREAAMRFGLHGIERRPDLFWKKVQANFWHYFRPEGLHYLLQVQGSIEPWRHAFTIALEDGYILGTIPFFLVFAFSGRRTPAGSLILLWCLYLLFFEIVVFLSEVSRHRSVYTPFAILGALEGARVLGSSAERRRWPTLAALVLSAVWIGALLKPYVGPLWRGIWTRSEIRSALAVLDAGDEDRAERMAESAAAEDPTSARVWMDYGKELVRRGKIPGAIYAYRHGAERALPENLRATLALPRLLTVAGRDDQAEKALPVAQKASWTFDPWLALEAAWRELPAPVTDDIEVGGSDYGAVRGFLEPRGSGSEPQGLAWVEKEARAGTVPPGPHRWTLHRAWLRLRPTEPSQAYDVVLTMGSPYPSTETMADVTVSVNHSGTVRFQVDGTLRPYTLRVPGAQELLVQVDAPTWNAVGEPAEQGIRIDRLTVRPAGRLSSP
jgi:4-amino-4-deoxy-L-arabinose transferase-like glycosyltransferase